MRKLRWPGALALALAVFPAETSTLSAQIGGCGDFDPECDTTAPTVSIVPAGLATADSLVPVTISWEDDQSLDLTTRVIRLRGSVITTSFQHSGVGAMRTSTGTVNLLAGANQLEAQICDASGNCTQSSATYTYTPPPPPPDTSSTQPPPDTATGAQYGVELSPDGDSVQVVAGARTTQGFLVRNVGNRTVTYLVEAPHCEGVTSCVAARDSLTVAPGGWTSVAVTHIAGANDSDGTIQLRVRQSGQPEVTDSASVRVNAVSAAGNVPVGKADALGVVERGLCLTVAVAGGMYQCGDLVIAQPIPGTVTLNKGRAPTLVYNSQHAHPYPIVATNFSLPSPSTLTQVRMSVRIAGRTLDAATKTFPAWTGGRRIAVAFDASSTSEYPTGIYDYTLTVDTLGASWGKLRDETGKLIVVNRSDSPFGPGWWLAGLERLIHRPDGTKLWVGGDGSARLYRPVAGRTDRWVATTVDRPDTLYHDGRAGEEYFRRLPGRAEVRFHASTGRHVATINRLGHRTSFGYDGSGRLLTITLPQGSGGGTPHVYTFAYTNGLLSSVTAPQADVPRAISFTRTGNELRITGPDTTSVRYLTEAGFAHRIHRRFDRLGNAVEYAYASAHKLNSVRQYGLGAAVVDTSDVVVTFTPAEIHGVGTPSGREAPYTTLNGPLPDSTGFKDHTYFWINRWGAPYRIRDAAQVSAGVTSRDTYLYREDGRFPALVTRVGYPNGREVSSSYDVRGRLESTTDWSVPGYATTVYTWDDQWDAPTSVTGPEGEVTLMGYDTVTGHRLWQQVGTDVLRRVRFFYNDASHATAPGLIESVQSDAAAARGESPERLVYDIRGNLRSVTSPLGVTTITEKDDIGRDVLVRSPIDESGAEQTVQTWYDEAGRVEESVTRGPAVTFQRTSHFVGQTIATTAPAQEMWVRNTYDANGNLRSVSRWSVPDLAGADTVTTSWSYDVFGRKVKETVRHMDQGGRYYPVSDSTIFDKAGRVERVRTRRGHEIRMVYDVLGRLRERIVPEVRYDSVSYVPSSTVVSSSPYRRWNFPLYKEDSYGNATVPNTGTAPSGLRIPADTARFTYDLMGNVLTANNRDARISRAYDGSGRLIADTLRIRTYAGADFTQHVYGLTYRYDRSGRRTELTLPDSLVAGVPWMSRTGYVYDAATGALASVGHPSHPDYPALSPTAQLTYNDEGQLQQLYRRAEAAVAIETYRYDADGRVRWQNRLSQGAEIHQDTFAYDPRGKVRQTWSLGDSTRHVYSGLGALAWSFTDRFWVETDPEEVHLSDALGNTYRTYRTTISDRQDAVPMRDSTLYGFSVGTGRLQRMDGPGSTYWTVYDSAGNQVRYTGATANVPYPGLAGDVGELYEDSYSYYGADEKLRVVDRRTCVFGLVPVGESAILTGQGYEYDCAFPRYDARPTFEEYRYDALGRRILVRTAQTWACGLGCVNGITRTVWEGDQIVAEIRAPAYAPERDRGIAYELNLHDQAYYGRTLYTHGGALDRPISMVRLDYDSIFSQPYVILPHTNALGSYDSGTFGVNGTGYGPCVRLPMFDKEDVEQYEDPYGNAGSQDHTAPGDSVDHCVTVNWPALYLWRTHLSRQTKTPKSWTGSLIQNKRDETGQLYMRNRFYSPSTGRFTQEDPIGIAGGLNVYGFANGDPVNFSDPYGLSADTVWVGVRPLQGIGGLVANHSSVRVNNTNTELMNREGVSRIESKDMTDPENASYFSDYEWIEVPPPPGYTQEQWDGWVQYSARDVGELADGAPYTMSGSGNCHRFTYEVMTRAGGEVPRSAAEVGGRLTPGICGGRTGPGMHCSRP